MQTVSYSGGVVSDGQVQPESVEITYYADGRNVTQNPDSASYTVEIGDEGVVSYTESVSLPLDLGTATTGLLRRLKESMEPIDIMWSGLGGTRVVTITNEMLVAFQAQFWQTCF